MNAVNGNSKTNQAHTLLDCRGILVSYPNRDAIDALEHAHKRDLGETELAYVAKTKARSLLNR